MDQGSSVGSAPSATVPNALCFGDGLPPTGAPCQVAVTAAGVTVTIDSPPSSVQEITVSFDRLSVSAGGLSHDQLVVKWGAGPEARTLYLNDAALIRAFRTNAPPELTGALEETATKVRWARTRHRTLWGIVLGVIGGLALFLWFGADLLVDVAVSRIPVEWERQLGEAAYRDFLAHQEVVKEGPAVTAAQEMTQRLIEQIPNNPYKFELTVVKSDVVNAFALPGGHVVVFTGLMKKAESGEEVAGVLGHELNHVLQRHGLERIVKSVGLMAVVAIIAGDQQGLVGLMRQLGVELLTLKFGRAQETEADLTGLHLLYRARIDPAGMMTFFQRLSEKEEGRVEWLSTHPMSAGRAERLKAELSGLPKKSPEPFTFDWSKVRESLEVQSVSVP